MLFYNLKSVPPPPTLPQSFISEGWTCETAFSLFGWKTTLKRKKKVSKLVSIPLILWFSSLRRLILFSLLSDWLQSLVMRQRGLELFSSQNDKVKNMKDTLNQSLIWTVSVWITAQQSSKYGRLAAVMVTDWYLKWLWNSLPPCKQMCTASAKWT